MTGGDEPLSRSVRDNEDNGHPLALQVDMDAAGLPDGIHAPCSIVSLCAQDQRRRAVLRVAFFTARLAVRFLAVVFLAVDRLVAFFVAFLVARFVAFLAAFLAAGRFAAVLRVALRAVFLTVFLAALRAVLRTVFFAAAFLTVFLTAFFAAFFAVDLRVAFLAALFAVAFFAVAMVNPMSMSLRCTAQRLASG